MIKTTLISSIVLGLVGEQGYAQGNRPPNAVTEAE